MSKILDLGLPLLSSFKSILSALVVVKGLVELILLVEYEWSLSCNRFVDWLSCKHHELGVVFENVKFQDFVRILIDLKNTAPSFGNLLGILD